MDREPLTSLLAATDFVILAVVLKSHFIWVDSHGAISNLISIIITSYESKNSGEEINALCHLA